jgi:hypothetical protein
MRAASLAPFFATILLLAACDKAEDQQPDAKQAAKQPELPKLPEQLELPEQPKPEQPKPAEGPVLTLGAAKIMEKNKPDQAIEIAADGTVKMGPDPEHTLKISTDGKVSKVDGTVVAQVGADGSLTFDGKSSGIVLNDAGLVLTAPNGKTATIRFTDEGVMVEPPPAEDMQMVAEGCTGPMAKTCALVMTMMLLTSEPVPAEAHGVEAAPAPTTIEAKKP